MQLDAICTHTDSHTPMQDRRYRARFSYKFPKGNTRRHQLSGALLLCFPSLLVSFPLSITHSASFILFFSASSTILFIHWPLNCSWSFHHFLTFNNSYLSRNESFFFLKKWSLYVYQPIVFSTVCINAYVSSDEIGQQQSRSLSCEGSYDAHYTSCIYPHQTHPHRLGPSTRSPSLGLRGRGEHGQSWHRLLMCVYICACVGHYAKVYICSPWTCPSSSPPSESSWPLMALKKWRLWFWIQHILSV